MAQLMIAAQSAAAVLSAWALSMIVYRRLGFAQALRLIRLPLCIWLLTASADFTATAEAAAANPTAEANPYVRYAIAEYGGLGLAVFAFLWVVSWLALTMLLETCRGKMPSGLVDLLQLTIIYTLAAGHLLAWAAWAGYGSIADGSPPLYYFPYLLVGAALGFAHRLLRERFIPAAASN